MVTEKGNISGTESSGWRISKKVGYALALAFVATVVVVGVLVYHVGVAGYDCDGRHRHDDQRPVALGGTTAKVTDVRLPAHLVPIKYEVRLVPFIVPDNFTIDGSVRIVMRAKAGGSRNVTIHSVEIDVDHAGVTVDEVIDEDGRVVVRKVPVSGHEFDEDREFYVIRLAETIKRGKLYAVNIKFTSVLNDNLNGFYRSSYLDRRTNKQEYIAVTQFQPTDARRAFPCFDEPALKAKFEISLGRLKDMTSISNMPIKQGGKGVPMEGNDEYLWDHYQESVPMSTYLVAFVVSRFGFEISPKTGNGVEFRIWARNDALDQIAYAKDIGPKILQYFETYFNLSYPLPKQDMIAIPDFGAGAMENWGLITYRETALLFKPGVSAARNKQRIATVVSHELAHQWFGNLVTPTWWTDLWLNEGFASYVEYLGVEAVQPELKLLEQFVIQDLQSVFKIDALDSSHPISIPVKHPDEINEIFDRISYAKGASIIRMMDKFLSEETFRAGLSNYLRSFAYKAAEQDDLWRYLTMQAHEDGKLPKDLTVKTIMDTWTLQTGFPVVTVTRQYRSNSADLVQDRFLLTTNGKASSKEDQHNYLWWIPITYAQPGLDNFKDTYNTVWMSDKMKRIEGLPDENEPVIFNVRQTGYYRVNYDTRNWKMIIRQLNEDHTKIHVVNRAQIIDDALNLARVGLLDYQLALGVTSYLEMETEYVPWSSALGNLNYLNNMLERTEAYGMFKRYMGKLILPLYNRVGFEMRDTDQHLDVYLRVIAIHWSCNVVGNAECIDKANALYKDWMGLSNPDERNPIDVNMKNTVYCSAIANGAEHEWDFGWERYNASNVASEKSSLLSGLACAKQVWLLNRYLNKSLSEGSGVRKADGRTVISRIAINTIGRDLAFDFVRDKWDKVVEYYGSASFSLTGLMKYLLSNRSTNFSLNEIKRFQKENEETLRTAKRAVTQAVEKTEANIRWIDRNYQNIFSWLTRQNHRME